MTGFRPRGLSEYAAILWRKKLFILVITAVVLLATIGVIKRLPDFYEAQAVVVVNGASGDAGRDAMSSEITLITKQLESQVTLAPLIQRHGLYPGLPLEAQLSQMRKALKVETKLRGYYPELPEAVVMTFRYSDPAVAQKVLADAVTFFVGTNEMTARQAAEEVLVIDSKIAAIEEQIRQQSVRRSSSAPVIDPRMARAERLAATATVESLKDRQYALERQIAEQRREINEQQQLVKVAPPTKQSGASGALLVRKAELEGQLKDYATQYTEKNPKVVQTRNQLAEINKQLAQLNEAADSAVTVTGTAEGRELRSLQRDLSRLETEMEVTRRELNRRETSLTTMPNPGTTATASGSDATEQAVGGGAEMGYLQSRYVALLDKRDRLQMALNAPGERGLAPFRVVDPPSVPRAPVGPDRTRLQLLALAIALATGLGAVVLLEAPRLSLIRDERDAEYFLGAPVVGLIPETLTPDERGHRRRVRMTRRLILLTVAALAVPLLALALSQLGLIQRIAMK